MDTFHGPKDEELIELIEFERRYWTTTDVVAGEVQGRRSVAQGRESTHHLSPAEALQLQERLFAHAFEIVVKKRRDYSGDDDPFANFRMSETYDVPAWKGVIIRLTDKLSRINQLAHKGGTGAVRGESLFDTAADVLNYTAILLGLLVELFPDVTQDFPDGKLGGSPDGQ